MRQLMVEHFRNQGRVMTSLPMMMAAALSLDERAGNAERQDGVAGMDIVGQLEALGLSRVSPAMAASYVAPGLANPMAIAGLNPQVLQQFQQAQSLKALQDQITHAAHVDKQSQLARAKFLPTKRLGVNSSAGTNIDGSGNVLAGATSTISVVATVPGRITGFEVASSCAPFFDIIDIKVAMTSLMAGSLGEPAENYLPDSQMPPLEIDIAAAGTPILVLVQNRDAVARLFRAGFGFIKLAPGQTL